MDSKLFITQVMGGEASAAKDTLNDLLSARAFEALDARKQQIAQTLYGDGIVEEEVEQLDELTGKGKLPQIAAYHKQKSAESKNKMETIRSSNTKLPVPKETSAKIYAKDSEAKYHANQAKRANALMKKEDVEHFDEAVTVKKEYDDEEESEHGVYNGKKKIGYVVHNKKENTHTAYHNPQGKDDYRDVDDFSHHDKAVSQIKKSAGI